ncbi:M48 family metallopeptidase [Apibacter sp. HY039]|uniref:tetratricopeptide repeat protein n=1 Tax=Apibacter sp. HY039 TaxID=2501476 RepID=UPI000FEB7F0D|nr:hypothetical protein [Apibacter sp. HY039]
MQVNKIILVFSIMVNLIVNGQNRIEMQKAEYFFKHKKYYESMVILKEYLVKYPDDIYANWLGGQVAYELGNVKLSKALYRKAIANKLDDRELRFNFAQTLYNSASLQEAESELNYLLKSDIKDFIYTEANLMLGYINLWRNDFDKTKIYIKKIKEFELENKAVKELEKQLQISSKPYLKINFDYTSDNQVLTTYSELVEAGIHKNKYFNPKLRVENQNFSTDKQVATIRIGNTFYVDKSRFIIYSDLGISQHFSESTGWLGELNIKRKIGRHLNLAAAVSRLPYTYTLRSTQNQVFENILSGSVEYENKQIFSIKAIYQLKFYKDNYINSWGGWVLSRPININKIQIKAGYGFSFSDSKTILYYPQTTSNLINSWGEVKGIYDPYFTPKQQITHSILGVISVSLTPSFILDISGNYAFKAQNESPVVFGGVNAEGQYVFQRYYYTDKNLPFSLKAGLNYKISENTVLSGNYQYQENSFYSQDKAGITFYYRF